MHQRIALFELYQCTKFQFPSCQFPKSKGAYENAQCTCYARALCTPHEMTCTIELRSLNSICVPNLVSIAQNFLEPEDPSQINFFVPVARSLHLKGTVTTKAYMLEKHACDLQVWHQRRVPSGL